MSFSIMVACAPALKPLFSYFGRESIPKERVGGSSYPSLLRSFFKRFQSKESNSMPQSSEPRDVESQEVKWSEESNEKLTMK